MKNKHNKTRLIQLVNPCSWRVPEKHRTSLKNSGKETKRETDLSITRDLTRDFVKMVASYFLLPLLSAASRNMVQIARAHR